MMGFMLLKTTALHSGLWMRNMKAPFQQSLLLPALLQQQTQVLSCFEGQIRLFGSKPGSPSAQPGEIIIENTQRSLPLDLDRLHRTVTRIKELIGYETYDVSVSLVRDKEMKAINWEFRRLRESTDILSFPFHSSSAPGKLLEPDFDIPDLYMLGDIIVDVPYVIKVCQDDEHYYKNVGGTDEGDIITNKLDAQGNKDSHEKGQISDERESDDEYEDDSRGVSGAMSIIFDPEERINMLLVHGMLHLIGYDHETDSDYKIMVEEEERILKELLLLPLKTGYTKI